MEGCYILDFKSIGEEEVGYLIAIENSKNIPFDIKRVFYTYEVPNSIRRGFHAHRKDKQVIMCLNGSLKVRCFNGKEEEIYELNSPSKGLYLEPMIWREIFDYKDNAVLVVLASELYDKDGYIRDYEEFLKEAVNP